MDRVVPSSPERVRLRERNACVACGGRDLESIWSGRFSHSPAREWLRQFHYSADVVAALGDEEYDLVECRGCHQRFHRRILDDDGLRTLYSRWIDTTQIEELEKALGVRAFDREFSGGVQGVRHILRIREALGGAPGVPPSLLDFGCGDGDFVLLASLFGLKASGIDFSDTRFGRAAKAGLPIAGSLEEMDAMGSGPLDAVTLFEVLEHVSAPLDLLRALAARLRPGGVLLVECPDCSGISTPATFEQFRAVQPLEHINTYTPGSLAAICRRAGFEPLPWIPAHVTSRTASVVKTELSRWLKRPTTSRYFVKAG